MHSFSARVYFQHSMNFKEVLEMLRSQISDFGYFTDDEDLIDKEFNYCVFGNCWVILYAFKSNKISEKFLYQLAIHEHSPSFGMDVDISDYLHSFLRKNGFSDLVTPSLDPSIPIKDEDYVLNADLKLHHEGDLESLQKIFTQYFRRNFVNEQNSFFINQFGCEYRITSIRENIFSFQLRSNLEFESPIVIDASILFKHLFSEKELKVL